MSQHQHVSQQQLFPEHLHFSPDDAEIIKQLDPDLKRLGFMLEPLGSNTFVVNGTPPEVANPQTILENIIENFKSEASDLSYDQNAMLARSMATNMAVKTGFKLLEKEMSELFKNLFACQVPTVSPTGKKTFVLLYPSDLENYFR